MKNIKRFFTVFLLLMIINLSISAVGVDASGGTDSGGSWLKKEDITHSFSDSSVASDTATNTLRTMTIVIKLVGLSVGIVMLLTVGMKYMMSAPGEKGEIKKHAVVYIIGAIVLFSAVGLLNIIEKFAGSINVIVK